MQAIGTCTQCKRNNAPIEVLQVDAENAFRGRCLACGAPVQGALYVRTEQNEVSTKPAQIS